MIIAIYGGHVGLSWGAILDTNPACMEEELVCAVI